MITKRQAAALRRRYDAFEAWRGGRSGYQASSVPRALRISNAQRGALEQFEFMRDKPERYFAYYRVCDIAGGKVDFSRADHRRGQPTRGYYIRVTTWTGDELASGRITSRECWQSNMGDYRASFEVTTPQGVKYVGTAFLTAGDYCRMQLKANQGN